MKLGSVCRADRAQSNGSTLRSLASFHIELEQFCCSLTTTNDKHELSWLLLLPDAALCVACPRPREARELFSKASNVMIRCWFKLAL